MRIGFTTLAIVGVILHCPDCRGWAEIATGAAIDQEPLRRFRKILKEQRDAVHLRLVFAREQSRGLSRSEIKDEGDRGSFSTANDMTAFQQTQAQEQLTENQRGLGSN